MWVAVNRGVVKAVTVTFNFEALKGGLGRRLSARKGYMKEAFTVL